MKLQDIRTAVNEAQRFLDRYDEFLKKPPGHDYDPSPERAALRRASLDLTKALAKMRRRDA